MKKIIAVLALSTLLFSCSSGPESAVRNFTENLAKGKIEEAKKYATEPAGMAIEFGGQHGIIKIDPDFTFEMIKDSIVGNRAWVTYVDQKGTEETLELIKIDGEWLVHMESKK